MSLHIGRRVDAAAFGLSMLAFCWWLHAALAVLARLSASRPTAPLSVLAVEAAVLGLVALAVPVLLGRPVFRLVRAVLAGVVRLALLPGRLLQPASRAARRPVSGGSR
jgi:hypothetical protein